MLPVLLPTTREIKPIEIFDVAGGVGIRLRGARESETFTAEEWRELNRNVEDRLEAMGVND